MACGMRAVNVNDACLARWGPLRTAGYLSANRLGFWQWRPLAKQGQQQQRPLVSGTLRSIGPARGAPVGSWRGRPY